MKETSSIRILAGLILGLIFGILASSTETGSFEAVINFISPLGSLWVNSIRMVVIPLLMALLITAIAGRDNGNAIAQLGGKTLALFVLFILFSALFAFLVAPPLLSLVTIDPVASANLLDSADYDPTASTSLPPFSDWFISLVPSNPFAAAVEGAILPLLIFTGLFASALLQIEAKQRDSIVEFFAAVKSAMFVMISWIMWLAPLGIFALVFPLAATLGVSAILVLGSSIAIICSLVLILLLLLYPLVNLTTGISIPSFARAIAPAQAIGFSTRSSLAALPATIAAASTLKIPERTTGIVLPIAVTLFKYASPLARTTGTYFVANLYGIDLSIVELLLIALSIGLLSFYSPGIPSGGLLIMAPVYLSLGLPIEGIGILIAIDLIVDMFLTMANVTANVACSAIIDKYS